DGKLLGALRCCIEPEEHSKGSDVPEDCPAAGEVSPEVGTKREDTCGDRDQAHRVAEQGSRLVAAERSRRSCGQVAHVDSLAGVCHSQSALATLCREAAGGRCPHRRQAKRCCKPLSTFNVTHRGGLAASP